jgi:hypothetical protein
MSTILHVKPETGSTNTSSSTITNDLISRWTTGLLQNSSHILREILYKSPLGVHFQVQNDVLKKGLKIVLTMGSTSSPEPGRTERREQAPPERPVGKRFSKTGRGEPSIQQRPLTRRTGRGRDPLYPHAIAGRTAPSPEDSRNGAWQNKSFRGFADSMQTEEFLGAIKELEEMSRNQTIVLLCAETLPWRCHRSLIGDALTAGGHQVEEILRKGRRQLHRLTPWAQLRTDVSPILRSPNPRPEKPHPLHEDIVAGKIGFVRTFGNCLKQIRGSYQPIGLMAASPLPPRRRLGTCRARSAASSGGADGRFHRLIGWGTCQAPFVTSSRILGFTYHLFVGALLLPVKEIRRG